MSDVKDDDLVRIACAGDVRAFELLSERHYDFMYRIAFRWCGNQADAEDITHNAFLKMADKLHDFRFESHSVHGFAVLSSIQPKTVFAENRGIINVWHRSMMI